MIFFPLMLVERKRIRSNYRKNLFNSSEIYSLLYGYKKNKLLLIYLGINFAIAQILFFLAYQIAGAINGSLAQQTTIIFALLFGFLIIHEKVSKIQILFSFILLQK